MAFKLAELFVQITGQTAQFNSALGGVRAGLLQTAALSKSVGSGLLAGLGVAGGAGLAVGLGLGLAKAVRAGSDLNETVNKTKVIFGDAAGVVTGAADEMASKFGVVKSEFMDMTSELGNILQGMGGQTRRAAAETGVALTRLAADASSIFNKGFDESAAKIASALRGQSEPISEFGIDVQEAAVEAEALRMGLVKSSAELTTQAKVAARASLVLRGLKVAEGDLAATSGGFANAFRGLGGRLTNAFATAGMAINPFVEKLLAGLNKGAEGLDHFFASEGFKAGVANVAYGFETIGWAAATMAQSTNRHLNAIAGWILDTEDVSSSLGDKWEWLKGTATNVVQVIGVAFRNWSLLMGQVGIRAMQLGTNFVEAIQWCWSVASTFAGWVGTSFVNAWITAFEAIQAATRNFADNVQAAIFGLFLYMETGIRPETIFRPLLDGFKATVSEMPKIAGPVFSDFSDDIAKLQDQINGNEAARVNAHGNRWAAFDAAATDAARPGREGAGGAEAKEHKGGFSGLEEFGKKLQESIRGGGAADRTAQGVGQLVTLQERQVQLAEQAARRPPAPGVAVGPR